MTSIGRQFDFHDIIYHKRHCNVGNRSFYNYWTFKTYLKIRVSVQTRVAGNSKSVQDGGIVIDCEGFVHIFNLFLC